MITELFHHRWTIPIVADLFQYGGARFVELINRLQISRDSLSNTLRYLDEKQLAIRNPGYGHPLRPEYILTERGTALGPICLKFMRTVEKQDLHDLALRKWPMPVLLSINSGAQRFNELRQELDFITPRALSNTLLQLEEPKLVSRHIQDLRPPATIYQLTPKARSIIPHLESLHDSLGA